jgi:predicted nucleotidyltransferase
MAGPILTALGSASRWFASENVPVAVIGGIAASILGRPRVTKDVDFLAIAEESSWPALLVAGTEHGIVPRVDGALQFARTTRVLLLVHEPSGVELDVSFASLPFERELVERATSRTIKGASFRVATPEDILIMKALALRPRDIADIEGILTAVPDLDLARVKKTIGEFSKVLETDDFESEFERILKRVRAQ